MSEFTPLRMLHNAAKPLINTYLARAYLNMRSVDTDTFEVDSLAARAELIRDDFMRELAEKIETMGEKAFNESHMQARLCDAILLDTTMLLVNDIPAGDDSHGDYMPDAAMQIQHLIADGYDGNGFLWFALHADLDGDDDTDRTQNSFDVFFMDDTSPIIFELNDAIRRLKN